MKKILLSTIGSDAGMYVNAKVPSELIPFRGEFPIVENYRSQEFFKEIQSKMFLEDCSEWVQKAVLRGKRICDLDRGFRNYLANNNIAVEDFLKKSNADKSTELVRFFNANSLTLDSLKV